MNVKIIASFLVLLTLTSFPIAYAASPGPSSWGTEAYGNFVKSLIVPDDPLVQQTLRSIAPVQDQARFAQNLLKVYEFVSQLPLPTSDSEFLGVNWMSAPEILQYGRGDCKNHAVLLTTLIEALYRNTFRYLPTDLVWIMAGLVDPGGTGQPGGHVWVLLNMDEVRSVSEDAYRLIRGTELSKGTTQVPVGAEPPWSKVARWFTVNLDRFADRAWWWPFRPQSVILDNHFYIELEATWNLSISEFFYKKYPYVELHDRWNSYEYSAFSNVNPPGTGTLWLSSTNWHYEDFVSWRAEGVTPNGLITVTIRGSWGSITFGDVTADSSGKAGFTFMIGRNILGSGQFVVTDRTTGSFLMQDYNLG